MSFFATAMNPIRQTSFLSYALKCIDPTSCFLRGYSPFLSTLLDREREGKLGKFGSRKEKERERGHLCPPGKENE